MKIGITQRGDACLDLSWVEKLEQMDGAIIISKGFNQQFDKVLINPFLQQKIIYHSTITSLGGTILQPNVPTIQQSYNHLQKIIDCGFQNSHIVVRIDPIIGNDLYNQIENKPSYQNINSYFDMLIEFIKDCYQNLGIRRFRYSFLDLYKHVVDRLNNANFNVPQFAMTFDQMKQWKNRLLDLEIKYRNNELYTNNGTLKFDTNIHFESCAQQFVPQHHKTGCISKLDFKILGLDENLCTGSSNQRKLCLCPCCKTELLNNRTRCEHKCLYCYWKD